MYVTAQRMPGTSQAFVRSSVIRRGLLLVTTGFGHAALVLRQCWSPGWRRIPRPGSDRRRTLRYHAQAHGTAQQAADVTGRFGRPELLPDASFSSCRRWRQIFGIRSWDTSIRSPPCRYAGLSPHAASARFRAGSAVRPDWSANLSGHILSSVKGPRPSFNITLGLQSPLDFNGDLVAHASSL